MRAVLDELGVDAPADLRLPPPVLDRQADRGPTSGSSGISRRRAARRAGAGAVGAQPLAGAAPS